MALNFPNGTVFGFSTTLSAPIVMSDIVNADPAMATLATSVNKDDVLLVTSGWSDLNDRVTVSGTTGTDVELLGIDTTDPALYPDGEGVGSVRTATGFINFDQQGDASITGGEPEYWTGKFLEMRRGAPSIQVAIGANPMTISLPLYFDPDKPWFNAAKNASKKGEPLVLRARLPNGDAFYFYGTMFFNPTPNMSIDNPMQNNMTFSVQTEVTFVEAA